MGRNGKPIRKWIVSVLSVGMMMSGAISIHAEDTGGDSNSTNPPAATEGTTSQNEEATGNSTDSNSQETTGSSEQKANTQESEQASSPAPSATATPASAATPESNTPSEAPKAPRRMARMMPNAAPAQESSGSTDQPTSTPTPAATPTPTPATPTPSATPDNSSEGASQVNIYRLYNLNNGDHFYTSDASEKDHLVSIGWRDEGIGWISPSKGNPVYRLYNPNTGEHFYTVSENERDILGSAGWRKEGTAWFSDTLNRVSVYRDYNTHNGNHNFTTSEGEHNNLIQAGWTSEDAGFYAMALGPAPAPTPKDPNDKASDGASEINMYRVYNPNSGEHFYTASTAERDHLRSLGWNYEGVGWVAPSAGKPVYRLYSPRRGDHFYTMSAHERDILALQGWRKEGTGWYSDTLGRVQVYRDYNTRTGSHNYTTSANEHNILMGRGWRSEGIAFSAMKGGYQRTYSHGDIPNFKESDPRWGNVRIGGYLFKNTGCMPTAISMAVSAIKYTTVTPIQVASYLHDHSDSFNVINHGGNTKSAEVAAEHWGITWEGMTSADQMADALAHGKLVVIQVGPGDFVLPGYSHAILLAGNSNGITTVFDPDAPNRRFNLYSIWNQRTTVPYDLIGGYVGIAMYQK